MLITEQLRVVLRSENKWAECFGVCAGGRGVCVGVDRMWGVCFGVIFVFVGVVV